MTLVYLAIAWLGGIWLAHQLWTIGLIGCETPGWPFVAVAVGLGLLAVVLRRRPAARLALVLALCGILGGWRYQVHPFAACPTPLTLAFYNGDPQVPRRATVEGVVVGFPDVRDVRTFYRLAADTLILGGERRPVEGELLVQAPRFPEHGFGDRLKVSGQLETPPTFTDFDYRAYLAQRNIHSLLRRPQIETLARPRGLSFWGVLYGLRERGVALLNRILPEPSAALANGMLLGIESGISPAVDEAFKATGTTHVIVISGSNIALLTGVLMGLLARLLGRNRATLPTALTVVLYVLLVGADPAALRAGIMGILYVIAIALGRASTAFVSLCFSALVMTAINPLTLWDIGFQLSFAATLGLILFTPAIQARVEKLVLRYLSSEQAQSALGFLNDALIVTLAAQLLTLPLIIYYFGRLSIVSLAANFLILPAQPPIMMGGMATLIGGLAWEPLGRAFALIPWFFLTYTTAVVRLLAGVPYASVETGAVGRMLALLYYVLLSIGMLLRAWPALRQHLPAPRQALTWAMAVILPAGLILTVSTLSPDGRLHVVFLCGEGREAALVTTPRGRQIWIGDGRGDSEVLRAAAWPFLRRGVADITVIGDPDDLLWPGASLVTPDRTPPGTVVRLEAGVDLARPAATDAWLLRHGGFATLLPSALRPEAQIALLTALPDGFSLTVLKTPAAGTGGWPTAEFLAASQPQVILWPEDTTYPPDVIAALSQRGAVRISEESVVEVISDGAQMWLQQRSRAGQR